MANYDFRALSPVDFEMLVRDLLQKDLHKTLESFKPGRDDGIDLRCYMSRGGTLVVQCKHYADSGFDKLLRDLEHIERPKLSKLRPRRYIIATSVGLTPRNKESIRKCLFPFCRGTADILGRADLNNLLTRFPGIERAHFKLWLTSSRVLERILHNRVFNVSRDELEKIQRRAKYYVQNESFNEARKILKRHNFCIIAGIPGIGKTTLAEMLIVYYLKRGYEFVKISGDIAEAAEVEYKDLRRVFYYDDFLGQSSDAEKFNKNEDERLLSFIEAVHQSGVSKLILTTREYILNQAKMRYEKLGRSRFDLSTCVIDLEKYTRLHKAKILFNHLYFSDLPSSFKRQLIEGKNYLRVIDHENYNPRLIEFLTDFSKVVGLREEQYWSFFRNNLDDPQEIWGHAFENQISDAGRHLLITLASLPSEVLLDDLRDAFAEFHAAKARFFGKPTGENDFMFALRELDGTLRATRRSPILSLSGSRIRRYVISSSAISLAPRAT